MPDETVIDREVVALDEDGRPSFNTLQNYGAAAAPLHFFIFDLLMLRGREVINEPLVKRRELIEKHVLPALAEPVQYSAILDPFGKGPGGWNVSLQSAATASMRRACAPVLGRKCASIRGGVCHRRIHAVTQEFRRAGHRILPRRQAGLCSADQEWLHACVESGAVQEAKTAGNKGMPLRKFARGKGRPVGVLTAARMMECRWLKPQVVGQFEFVEWTSDGHLRQSKFVTA